MQWRSCNAVALYVLLTEWFHLSRGERIKELWEDYPDTVFREYREKNIKQ